jgi:nicotinamide mononucleotide adenylyltransferase
MTGIIVGRFQVPYLHAGHLNLIATSLRECDTTIILLGTPPHTDEPRIDDRNPYGVAHRVRMIKQIFPQLIIQVLYDAPNDQDWSTDVDNFAGLYPNPILYHSRDSFKNHYMGRIPLKEVEEVPGYSGTKLRSESNKT